MMLTRKYVVAAMMLYALLGVSCSKTSPKVEIEVDPKQLNAPGLVKVTWKTQALETTTISSNPALSGLPKTVTGNESGTDSFQVNRTTTFEIRGQTATNTGPFTKVASATVTVVGSAPVK
jgi:hypothetical protein